MRRPEEVFVFVRRGAHDSAGGGRGFVVGLRGPVVGHRSADETCGFELPQCERESAGGHGQFGAQLGEAARSGERRQDRERPFLQTDVLPFGRSEEVKQGGGATLTFTV